MARSINPHTKSRIVVIAAWLAGIKNARWMFVVGVAIPVWHAMCSAFHPWSKISVIAAALQVLSWIPQFHDAAMVD